MNSKRIQLGNKSMRDYIAQYNNNGLLGAADTTDDFHSNWNSLMKVLKVMSCQNHEFEIIDNCDGPSCVIRAYNDDGSLQEEIEGDLLEDIENDGLLSVTYSAVLQFLDWADEHTEWIRFIGCDCGNYEQFPADMSRHKSQHFNWVENIDHGIKAGEAWYQCLKCNAMVASQCNQTIIQE